MTLIHVSCKECKGVGCKDCSGWGTWWEEPADDIHTWFNLTYAQYLTIPRSVLQSMPYEWQQKFVQCLKELDDTIDWYPKEGKYHCEIRKYEPHLIGGSDPVDDENEPMEWCNDCYTVLDDPLQDYQRGRRKIPHKEKKDE